MLPRSVIFYFQLAYRNYNSFWNLQNDHFSYDLKVLVIGYPGFGRTEPTSKIPLLPRSQGVALQGPAVAKRFDPQANVDDVADSYADLKLSTSCTNTIEDLLLLGMDLIYNNKWTQGSTDPKINRKQRRKDRKITGYSYMTVLFKIISYFLCVCVTNNVHCNLPWI